jgi:hypothetical protein
MNKGRAVLTLSVFNPMRFMTRSVRFIDLQVMAFVIPVIIAFSFLALLASIFLVMVLGRLRIAPHNTNQITSTLKFF